MAGSMEDALRALGMSPADVEKALSFGTAAFEAKTPQAEAVAMVMKEFIRADNAAGWVATVGAAGGLS